MEVKKSGKNFEDRNSMLTELLKINHVRVLKNVFYALLVSYIIQELIVYFIQSKSTSFGLGILIKGFDNLLLGIVFWIVLFSCNLLIVPLFRLWAYMRREISPVSSIKHSYDAIALVVLICYYALCFYFVAILANKSHFGYITAMVLHLENMRLIMQVHSFVRTNVPKVLKYKLHSDQVLELPRISNYLYFSFAPTLIYQDTYPRRKYVDVKFVVKCFFEMFCMIWLMCFLSEKYYLKLFHTFGHTKVDWSHFTLSLFDYLVFGWFIVLFIFFVLLHCWYNAIGELIGFADRQFYSDWWTSNDFGDFYRRWHTCTQDWLYFYVYKDFKESVTPNNDIVAKVIVTIVSGIAHDYIILAVLEQKFPMMFLAMIATLPSLLVKLKNPHFNIFFLLCHSLFMNSIIHFNLMEHFTQLNCPAPKDDVFLQFVPRVFTADCHLK